MVVPSLDDEMAVLDKISKDVHHKPPAHKVIEMTPVSSASLSVLAMGINRLRRASVIKKEHLSNLKRIKTAEHENIKLWLSLVL